MSSSKCKGFYDAVNSDPSDPIVEKLVTIRDDVGDKFIERIVSERKFRLKSPDPTGFPADTTRLSRLDTLNGHSFDGTIRRWFLDTKEVELISNEDDDSMAKKLFRVVLPIFVEHLEKHRADLVKAKNDEELKKQLKVISEGIGEDIKQKAQTDPELKKELADYVKEFVTKKVKYSVIPRLLLKLTGLAHVNPLTMIGLVQEMNHQSLHDAMLARDFASKSQWKTKELNVDLIKFLKKDNSLQMVVADKMVTTDQTIVGKVKDIAGQSQEKGEEMLNKGAEMLNKGGKAAGDMLAQGGQALKNVKPSAMGLGFMGSKDKESKDEESPSELTKSDDAGNIENSKTNLPDTKEDAVDLSQELKEFYDEDSARARQLTNMVLSLLAVFVSPYFRNGHGVVLAIDEMELRLQQMLIDEVTKGEPMDEKENLTLKTAEFVLKLAALETERNLHGKAAEVTQKFGAEKALQDAQDNLARAAENVHGKAAEVAQKSGAEKALQDAQDKMAGFLEDVDGKAGKVAQKVGADKALEDAQNTLAGFLVVPLKMLTDEAKKQARNMVQQKMDSKFQEVIEVFVKLTGTDKENVDEVLGNVKEGQGEVYNWLKVLCYPVFAPDHKEASEYIVRKLVLFKKIKKCLNDVNDGTVVSLRKKIEEITQPFQEKIDKEPESVFVFSEDGPSEESKGSGIEIRMLGNLLNLPEERVDTWISALNGDGVALLEKLKLDEKSQQLKGFKNSCVDELKKEHAAMQKNVQKLSDCAESTTKTASDMVQCGMKFAGNATNIAKAVQGQASAKKDDTKPQQSH